MTQGPDAVAIEPIAASLGATKGSGYWHFASRRELLESALAAWTTSATDDVITALDEAGGTPVERMSRLLAWVRPAAERSPAEMLLMGSADPSVRAAVAVAMTRRLACLERLLIEAGLPRSEARTRAVLAYSAYLGFAMLATASPDVLTKRPVDRRRIQRAMLELTAVAGASTGVVRAVGPAPLADPPGRVVVVGREAELPG